MTQHRIFIIILIFTSIQVCSSEYSSAYIKKTFFDQFIDRPQSNNCIQGAVRYAAKMSSVCYGIMAVASGVTLPSDVNNVLACGCAAAAVCCCGITKTCDYMMRPYDIKSGGKEALSQLRGDFIANRAPGQAELQLKELFRDAVVLNPTPLEQHYVNFLNTLSKDLQARKKTSRQNPSCMV